MTVRKNSFSISLSLFLPLIYCTFPPSCYALEKPTIQLSGHVDYQASVLAAAGVQLSQSKLPAKVNKVLLGTAAHYNGLEEGDTVTKLDINEIEIKLWINRNGNNYLLKLPTPSAAKISSVSLSAKIATSQPEKAPKEKPKEKPWETYDVVFLVDKSSSMNDTENSINCTRWEWCQREIYAFSSQELEASGRTLTVGFFNERYTLTTGCNVSKLREQFSANSPNGNTDFGTPLKAVIDGYLDGPRTRPLLVIVMTDGVPNRGNDVTQVIINATQRMYNAKEIRISFLEIGDDFEGERLLQNLDSQLIPKGARYDIVNLSTFAELRAKGLKEAIKKALE